MGLRFKRKPRPRVVSPTDAPYGSTFQTPSGQNYIRTQAGQFVDLDTGNEFTLQEFMDFHKFTRRTDENLLCTDILGSVRILTQTSRQ